jgi:hypothetical protein
MRFSDVYIVGLYLCCAVQHCGQIAGNTFGFYGRIKNAGLKQGEVMGCEKGLQRGGTGFVMPNKKKQLSYHILKICPFNASKVAQSDGEQKQFWGIQDKRCVEGLFSLISFSPPQNDSASLP